MCHQEANAGVYQGIRLSSCAKIKGIKIGS